jgi:DNA-damage-inducible protein J
MSKSVYVRARIEPSIKAQAEDIFHRLGLTSAEAVCMFYMQVCLHDGLPFEVKIPNKETIKAINEARKGKGLVKCKDVDDLFDQLGL